MPERRYPRGSMPAHLELRDDLRCPCGAPTAATVIVTGPVCDVLQECEAHHRFRVVVHRETRAIGTEYAEEPHA
jgi:hypothetical protein